MGDVNGHNSVAFGPEVGAESRGQIRFAKVLANGNRGRLLHVHGLGWHVWDGARWALDEGEVIARNAVIDMLTAEWKNAYGDRELSRDVEKCQTAAGIAGILSVAEVLDGIAAKVSDLDADPWLLNCANGTLDLHTMGLRRHNPADRITKVTRAAYRPGERSHEWDAFLARSIPDRAVRDYLARFVGVALIGEVVEQSFTVATGTGANGKGVFYETVQHALGDYGHMMDSDILTASRHGSGHEAKPGLVDLRGRRFVVTSETAREVRLDETLMKLLTGGDLLTARALYQSPIQFTPSHSLLMVTNHLPKVPGNDPAVWRRLRVVPFNVVIPEEERDAGLKARLKLTATDAILTWAVDGLVDYRRRGMDAPEAVRTATADYQRRSDSVARYLEERCIAMRTLYVPFSELWDDWARWANEEGADEVSKREFGDELDRRGYTSGQKKLYGKNVKVRLGIGLQGTDEEGR